MSIQGAVAELDKAIAELNKEIERLTKIRSSLFSGAPTPGTPKLSTPVQKSAVPAKKKRTLSAEGRRNILEANKRRWAAAKNEKAKK